MELVDPSSLGREQAKLGRRLRFGASLPDRIFAQTPEECRLLEFDLLLAEDFLRAAQGVARRLSESHLMWGVLRPHPTDYFLEHFGKVPWLRIGRDDPVRQAILALHEDPGDSPGDAPAIRGDGVALYGESLRWLIFGDRDLELAVLALFDERAEAAWSSVEHRLYTVGQAIEELLPAIYGHEFPARLAIDLQASFGRGRASGRAESPSVWRRTDS